MRSDLEITSSDVVANLRWFVWTSPETNQCERERKRFSERDDESALCLLKRYKQWQMFSSIMIFDLARNPIYQKEEDECSRHLKTNRRSLIDSLVDWIFAGSTKIVFIDLCASESERDSHVQTTTIRAWLSVIWYELSRQRTNRIVLVIGR